MNDIIEINIKNINDKYIIYFNKCIYNNNFIKSYEGKNLLTNEKIIIDIYTYNIIFLAKRLINNIIHINHPNIINILDIIIEVGSIYFIKSLINKKIIDIPFNKDIAKQLIRGIEYLFDKNIEINELTLDNLFYDNNLLKISPYFSPNNPTKKILYGSPLYSPPEFLPINRSEKEITILLNYGLLIYKLSTKKYINENIINDNVINKLEIDENNEFGELLMKIFYKSRLSINDIYDFFNIPLKKRTRTISINEELFNMEI